MRLALVDDQRDQRQRVVVDSSGAMPGRGAYLCRTERGVPASDCLARATRRGGLARAFRAAVAIAPTS